MCKCDKIKKLPDDEFKRLTGVKKVTFAEMVAILDEKEIRKPGGRPNSLCVEDRILIDASESPIERPKKK